MKHLQYKNNIFRKQQENFGALFVDRFQNTGMKQVMVTMVKKEMLMATLYQMKMLLLIITLEIKGLLMVLLCYINLYLHY